MFVQFLLCCATYELEVDASFKSCKLIVRLQIHNTRTMFVTLYIDLSLCDPPAGRSLFDRRRSEVVRRPRPQDDFLLTAGQHLIQFLWREETQRTT